MLRMNTLQYDLPADLVATRAVEPRDRARMMVVSRSDPALLEHRIVRELPDYLTAGDLMIFNRSRVLPARLLGVRERTGGRIEGLFLEVVAAPSLKTGETPVPPSQPSRPEAAPVQDWRVLLRSNGRLRAGLRIRLLDALGGRAEQSIILVSQEGETWVVRPDPPAPDAAETLDRIGWTPLPPYILHARREAGLLVPDAEDRLRYQTVYAAPLRQSFDGTGLSPDLWIGDGGASVAAPTAGLHFTPALLAALEKRGVERGEINLHVGWGTFKPVKVDCLEEHEMHAERAAVPAGVMRQLIHQCERSAGHSQTRVIAVGTTSARALESIPAPIEAWANQGWFDETRLLIAPGYRWRHVDAMLTNFHLPRSTLLAMVAALVPGGVDRIKELYAIAVRERYRFYSYGDAMLILP